MNELLSKCILAKNATQKLISISTTTKNNALKSKADALIVNADTIIKANKKDIDIARANGTREAMIDRLTLTADRIKGISDGVLQVMALNDPIG